VNATTGAHTEIQTRLVTHLSNKPAELVGRLANRRAWQERREWYQAEAMVGRRR
jgi:hypothetical protein